MLFLSRWFISYTWNLSATPFHTPTCCFINSCWSIDICTCLSWTLLSGSKQRKVIYLADVAYLLHPHPLFFSFAATVIMFCCSTGYLFGAYFQMNVMVDEWHLMIKHVANPAEEGLQTLKMSMVVGVLRLKWVREGKWSLGVWIQKGHLSGRTE